MFADTLGQKVILMVLIVLIALVAYAIFSNKVAVIPNMDAGIEGGRVLTLKQHLLKGKIKSAVVLAAIDRTEQMKPVLPNQQMLLV